MQDRTLKLSIKYISNTQRFSLSEDVSFSNGEELIQTIKDLLVKEGVAIHTELLKIYDDSRNILLDEANITEQCVDGSLSVYCSQVIAPYGEVRVDLLEGLRYTIRTSETPHVHYPHVHVEYGEEDIFISLENFKPNKSLKSPQKTKEAIRYVKKNIVKLRKLWNTYIK